MIIVEFFVSETKKICTMFLTSKVQRNHSRAHFKLFFNVQRTKNVFNGAFSMIKDSLDYEVIRYTYNSKI